MYIISRDIHLTLDLTFVVVPASGRHPKVWWGGAENFQKKNYFLRNEIVFTNNICSIQKQ